MSALAGWFDTNPAGTIPNGTQLYAELLAVAPGCGVEAVIWDPAANGTGQVIVVSTTAPLPAHSALITVVVLNHVPVSNYATGPRPIQPPPPPWFVIESEDPPEWRPQSAPTPIPTTPGGSNTYVQYNNSGAFGGSSKFVWVDSTPRLTITGDGDGSTAQGPITIVAQGGNNIGAGISFDGATNLSGGHLWNIFTTGSTITGGVGQLAFHDVTANKYRCRVSTGGFWQFFEYTSGSSGTVQIDGDTSGTAVGPLTVKATGTNNTIGTAISLDSGTLSGGKVYSFISTGAGAAPGAGNFSLYSSTDDKYVFFVNGNGEYIAGQSVYTVLGQVSVYPRTSSTKGLVVKGAASRSVALMQLQTSAGDSLGTVGGSIFNDSTDTTTTHTDGTEDDLYSYTLVANTFAVNNDSVEQAEHVQFVGSATAARRLKKYFAGTLIFDSGSLTLSAGGDFTLRTLIIRESSSVVRVTVSVTTTSASTVPYSTYTRITGLTLTATNILKTTGIASGVGAASGDILNKLSKGWAWPAA